MQMTGKDFENDDYSISIKIKEQSQEISLSLSDDLEIIDNLDEFPKKYSTQILEFINNSAKWYPKVISKIKDEFDENTECQLTEIFILHEPNENQIYGLSFWISSDIEHGRGIKITGNYEIIEYGNAEISFIH